MPGAPLVSQGGERLREMKGPAEGFRLSAGPFSLEHADQILRPAGQLAAGSGAFMRAPPDPVPPRGSRFRRGVANSTARTACLRSSRGWLGRDLRRLAVPIVPRSSRRRPIHPPAARASNASVVTCCVCVTGTDRARYPVCARSGWHACPSYRSPQLRSAQCRRAAGCRHVRAPSRDGPPAVRLKPSPAHGAWAPGAVRPGSLSVRATALRATRTAACPGGHGGSCTRWPRGHAASGGRRYGRGDSAGLNLQSWRGGVPLRAYPAGALPNRPWFLPETKVTARDPLPDLPVRHPGFSPHPSSDGRYCP